MSGFAGTAGLTLLLMACGEPEKPDTGQPDSPLETDCSDEERSCDGVDDDCDGEIDEGLTLTVFDDLDGDGWGASGSATEACAPGEDQVLQGGGL